MVSNFDNILCIVVLSTLLVIKSSTSNPLEDEKLVSLSERFDAMQTRMDALEDENKMFKSETVELKIAVEDLKLHKSEQDEEILQLKKQISNLESLLPTPIFASNDAINMPSNTNLGPSLIDLGGPPSSCQRLKDSNSLNPMDGIHLLRINNKIQAAFCAFPRDGSPALQQLIGNVEVKTKSVYFYVQKNTSYSAFGVGGVIPFELARLNEGEAMDLESGIFTAPVTGIYHFEFTGLKDRSVAGLLISLQVNGNPTGVNGIGSAFTSQTGTGSYDGVSLSASLRLKVNDKVSLFHIGRGVVYDDESAHYNHFSGWLMEEDFE